MPRQRRGATTSNESMGDTNTKMKRYRSGEKALTSDQVDVLLNHPQISVFDEALLRLAINTGLRRNDLVKVKKEEYNPESGVLSFFEQKKRRTRLVDLTPNTCRSLNRMMETEGIWLFPSKTQPKKHISSRTAYNILQRNLEAAGLPPRPIHALRATCVKLCQQHGWTPEQTAEQIGDSVRVVQEHYSTPSREEMHELTQKKPII